MAFGSCSQMATSYKCANIITMLLIRQNLKGIFAVFLKKCYLCEGGSNSWKVLETVINHFSRLEVL